MKTIRREFEFNTSGSAYDDIKAKCKTYEKLIAQEFDVASVKIVLELNHIPDRTETQIKLDYYSCNITATITHEHPINEEEIDHYWEDFTRYVN